jgi:hypothetical protein
MASRINWRVRHPLALFGVLGTLIVLLLVIAAALGDNLRREKTMSVEGTAAPAITTDDLDVVGRTRVFFGHQSVGVNVLDGVPGVFAKHNIAAPPIELDGTEPGPAGGFISHEFIGENEKPLTKIESFDKAIRGGIGDKIDVALMKLCYIDIMTTTDVDALFASYRDTMTALERDYPDVTFIHATVPLTTEPSFVSKLKMRLKGSDRFGAAENVARERYNELVRAQYGSGHLLDLAAIESTQPDGKRDVRTHDGQQYFTLSEGYAADLGHLNAIGSEIAATAFLQSIAQASRK